MKHGLECPCDECRKIKKLLRDGVRSGEIYLVGLAEDKKKVLKE